MPLGTAQSDAVSPTVANEATLLFYFYCNYLPSILRECAAMWWTFSSIIYLLDLPCMCQYARGRSVFARFVITAEAIETRAIRLCVCVRAIKININRKISTRSRDRSKFMETTNDTECKSEFDLLWTVHGFPVGTQNFPLLQKDTTAFVEFFNCFFRDDQMLSKLVANWPNFRRKTLHQQHNGWKFGLIREREHECCHCGRKETTHRVQCLRRICKIGDGCCAHSECTLYGDNKHMAIMHEHEQGLLRAIVWTAPFFIRSNQGLTFDWMEKKSWQKKCHFRMRELASQKWCSYRKCVFIFNELVCIIPAFIHWIHPIPPEASILTNAKHIGNGFVAMVLAFGASISSVTTLSGGNHGNIVFVIDYTQKCSPLLLHIHGCVPPDSNRAQYHNTLEKRIHSTTKNIRRKEKKMISIVLITQLFTFVIILFPFEYRATDRAA